MINCRNCINWLDESLKQIEADHNEHRHIFMGCRIFGFIENNENLESCKYYTVSENLFAICGSCNITVPKVCISLGECINCTDTDLFCVESCKGGESRKYCTHFIRLRTEGIPLIDKGHVFDLFPKQDLAGERNTFESGSPAHSDRPDENSDEGADLDSTPAKPPKI